MSALAVGVRRDDAPGELRVALGPDGVSRLTASGLRVVVEDNAGLDASFANETYADAGAEIVSAADLFEQSDIVVTVGKPAVDSLREGQALVGLLGPLAEP